MIIKLSPDLKKEEIYANGNELANIMGMDRERGRRVLDYPMEKKVFVHSFNNPVLLTDNYRISQLNPSLRDTIFSLFSSRLRIVEYDGVGTIDDGTYKSVWCPSIDTILFALALKRLFRKRENFHRAVEIGTGSGFLSKYALAKNKHIGSILVNDLNPFAIKCAMNNIHDKRVVFYQGDGIEKIKEDKYDLIMCNPPYIPRPDSIDDNPYEGVSLLYNLVHNGHSYLNKNGILIVNISSLCAHILFKRKPKMKMTVLAKLKVPLKVNNVMNNKEWLRYLTGKKIIKKKFNRGYEYWQELKIVSFENI
ncbi:MAG: class I SAM-dependent methyltransferase [Nanoarchaeota archaeon]|nr:class I SAM-dependent methyltransferase [Nanoarchaeota archaeon]